MKRFYFKCLLVLFSFKSFSQESITNKVETILTLCETVEDIYTLKSYLQETGVLQLECLMHVPDINPINPKNNIKISSKFSSKRLHPIYGNYKKHNGVDIVADLWTPIYAAASGKINNSKFYNGSAGHSVEITHKYGFVTRYFHLAFFIVKNGEYVSKGDLIGYLGGTGNVTGPHLHYEVIKNNNFLDPLKIITFIN